MKLYSINKRTHLLNLLLTSLLFVLSAIIENNVKAQMVLSGDVYVKMETTADPIYLVVDSPSSNAIMETGQGGNIVSENENAIVRWNTGGVVSTGFIIPFVNLSDENIPFSFDVDNPASGQGSIDFSTYATTPDNLPLPSGVSILENTGNGNINDGDEMYNRYWKIDAVGFASDPELNLNFGYTGSEQTNGLTPGVSEMQAQFFNDQSSSWVGLFGNDNLIDEISGAIPNTNLSNARFWTLVERPLIETTDTVVACDEYTWIDGVTYTSSTNTPTELLTSSQGLDSLVTLDLTINESTTSTLVETACDTYTLNGQTYTSTGIYNQTIPNAVGCDSTITLDLTINESTTSTLVETACDTYTLNGQTYTSTGIYNQTIPNAAGCDSTITLDLTINESTTSTLVETACDTYTLNGQTYTSTGIYNQTIPNAAGCDSTITLDLTINESTTSTLVETACDTYTLNGQTYTSTGIYNQTIPNAAGCDSTITLDLTINESTTSTLVEAACDTYTLNGQTYTSTGIYNQTIPNAAGCDSTITLDLTINESTTSTLVETACDTYTLNGQTYTSTGIYNQTIPNAAGCDSTITLDLTINESTTSTLVETACDTYTLNGQTYTSTGIYNQTIPNVAGCDSTITLDLTINENTTSTLVETACDTYTLNGQTYTSTGIYNQTIPNAAGCDSTITLDLTINTVNVGVTITGDSTIEADAQNADYQWIDCESGEIIDGATNRVFTALSDGEYAVIITENGCTDTSDCVVIHSLNLTENQHALSSINLYPNPGTGVFTLEGVEKNQKIVILNSYGQKIKYLQTTGEKTIIDLTREARGIYMVKGEGFIKKIVKQ